MDWKRLLFGRPLRSEEDKLEEIGPLSAVPVLGLDALSSAAYGPEAALAILLPLGILAPNYIGPILGLIILVLAAVCVSYRQTIPAYPQGGGSFTVAKENLGRIAGLLAASALCLDYVLNVAVAISAGVGAMVSAVPGLLHYTLILCLIILVVITIANLRGVHSAGLIFMFPTYLYVGCLGVTIILGGVKILLSHGHPTAVVEPPHISASTPAASLWLLIRAFASGCTALTGIEAVSNAVPIFRKPKTRLAQITLTIIATILALLLAGIAYVSHHYHICAAPQGQTGYQSVLSQMTGAVTGRGAFYFISMIAILFVLAFSANTSYADFPRVCRLLALDEYLPAGFAHRGRRLVYTKGIIVLAVLAGALLIVFDGITDRLIPLFAVGAFTAFTLSQLGMVFYWRRNRGPHWVRSTFLNGVGAVATGCTLIIMAISKFLEGAWITIVAFPVLVFLFLQTRRHYEKLGREIDHPKPLDTSGLKEPIVVIPLKRLDEMACKALRFALTLSGDIYGIQIRAEEMKTENLSRHWPKFVEEPALKAGRPVPKLIVVPSPYREFFHPLIDSLRKLASEHADRNIAVIVPELVEKRWFHFILPHRATLLKGLLLLRGGPQIVVINTPWYRD